MIARSSIKLIKNISFFAAFISASSFTLFINYFHNLGQLLYESESFPNIYKTRQKDLIRFPIFDNRFDSNELNDVFFITPSEHGTNKVELKLNKSFFSQRLSLFVRHLIYESLKSKDIDYSKFNGEMYYKLEEGNMIDVLVKWSLKNKEINYFDSFLISLNIE